MNVDLLAKVLRIAVPIGMFAVAFVLLTLLTDLNLFIRLIISLGFGLLDVFVIAPWTDRSVDKLL